MIGKRFQKQFVTLLPILFVVTQITLVKSAEATISAPIDGNDFAAGYKSGIRIV